MNTPERSEQPQEIIGTLKTEMFITATDLSQIANDSTTTVTMRFALRSIAERLRRVAEDPVVSSVKNI